MKTALMRRPVRTLIHDSFLLDRANPLASPLKAEPGPGFATVTDTGSKLSISGGQLRSTSTTVSGSDPKLQWPDQGSRPGTAIIFWAALGSTANTANKLGTSNFWLNKASNTDVANFSGLSCTTIIRVANMSYMFVADPLGMKCFALCRPSSTGAGFAAGPSIGRAVTPELLLLWIYRGTVDTAAFVTTDTVVRGLINAVQVVDLGAGHPLATSYGICLDRQVSPTSPAVSKAPGLGSLTEFVWNPAANEVVDLWIKRQDASNGYIVRLDQAAGTAKTYEVAAGVETLKLTQTPTFSVGTKYRIQIHIDGGRIRPFVLWPGGATAPSSISTGLYNDADGVYVSGFSSADELTVWPLVCTKFWPTGV